MTPRLRLTLHALILAVILASIATERLQASGCSVFWMTGYVRGEGNAHTADGTSVWTSEPLVAATSLPLGSYVWVPEWGQSYRVADRGLLAADHLDFLTDSRAQAFAITGRRVACVGGAP